MRKSPLRSQLLADLDALDLGEHAHAHACACAAAGACRCLTPTPAAGAFPYEDEASIAASSDGAHDGRRAVNGGHDAGISCALLRARGYRGPSCKRAEHPSCRVTKRGRAALGDSPAALAWVPGSLANPCVPYGYARQRALPARAHTLSRLRALSRPQSHAGGHEAESADSPLVAGLNTFTADRFFLDTSRQVKAVLFTKKTEVPTLWQQVLHFVLKDDLAAAAVSLSPSLEGWAQCV